MFKFTWKIFLILFFELWLFLLSEYGKFLINFSSNSKIKNRIFFFSIFICFSTFRVFHKNLTTVSISIVGKWPKKKEKLELNNLKRFPITIPTGYPDSDPEHHNLGRDGGREGQQQERPLHRGWQWRDPKDLPGYGSSQVICF